MNPIHTLQIMQTALDAYYELVGTEAFLIRKDSVTVRPIIITKVRIRSVHNARVAYYELQCDTMRTDNKSYVDVVSFSELVFTKEDARRVIEDRFTCERVHALKVIRLASVTEKNPQS